MPAHLLARIHCNDQCTRAFAKLMESVGRSLINLQWWIWVVILTTVLLLVGALVWWRRRRRLRTAAPEGAPNLSTSPESGETSAVAVGAGVPDSPA
jgi:hypothetical protein